MKNQRYIELSRISNAVLLGETTTYVNVQQAKHHSTFKAKPLTDAEKVMCKQWCDKQLSDLRFSASTSVLESGL